MISNPSTTDNQLLELKVKHLRCYLQAKDISHNTCTEKQELVDLIKQNRNRTFTRLFNQQSTTVPPRASSPKTGPFVNFQNTVSSLANQVNSFASNVQDYVTNTVSDALNTTIGDQPTTNPNLGPMNYPRTTVNNPNPGPMNHPRNTVNNPSPGPINQPRSTVHNSQQQQQQRRPAAAASSASVDRTNIDLSGTNCWFYFRQPINEYIENL